MRQSISWIQDANPVVCNSSVKSTYFENDDILQIRMLDKPIAREMSEDWHTNISYAEDGTIFEIAA